MSNRYKPDDSFEALFRENYRGLVSALAVAAGSFDAADDAVQDAFLQAYRHWGRVATYESPAGWIRRVAVNRISNQHRSRRRRDAAVRLIAPENAPSADRTDRVAVSVAMTGLDARERVMVCLYYVGDLSVADIADACSAPEGTVKSVLHGARKKLSRELGAVK